MDNELFLKYSPIVNDFVIDESKNCIRCYNSTAELAYSIRLFSFKFYEIDKVIVSGLTLKK